MLLLGMVDRRNDQVYDDIFKKLEEIAMNDETLKTAFQNWELLSGTQDEVLAYESRLKRVLDEEAAIREAELRAQEAEIRGEKRGEERGEKRGEKRGEQKAKEETARLLLDEGFDVETVVRLSRLPEEQVIKIKEDM